jgi:hypothetical protein
LTIISSEKWNVYIVLAEKLHHLTYFKRTTKADNLVMDYHGTKVEGEDSVGRLLK